MDTETFPSDLGDEDLDDIEGTGDAGDPDGGAEGNESNIAEMLIRRGVDPQIADDMQRRFVPKSEYQRAKEEAKRATEEYQRLYGQAAELYQQVQARNGASATKADTEGDFEEVRRALLSQGEEGAALAKMLDLYAANVEKRVDAKYAGAAQQTHKMRVDSYLKERKQALRSELGKGLDKIWPEVEKLSRQYETDPEQILNQHFRSDYRKLVASSVANENRKQRDTQRTNTMEGGAMFRNAPPLTGGPSRSAPKTDAAPKRKSITDIANEVLRDVLR